jgi:hypothetical protein
MCGLADAKHFIGGAEFGELDQSLALSLQKRSTEIRALTLHEASAECRRPRHPMRHQMFALIRHKYCSAVCCLKERL